ncbi:hypothetical protein [Sphingobacterium anhuiense]|uniref:Peptidase A2 domain-containing protein n=1 Tax=Sphingobacterium anhuiense TaxID=493780 RepID=A0ABW5YQ15_9SPHI
MKDSTYLFLWDTGADASIILKDQVKLRNIPIEILNFKAIDTLHHSQETFFVESEIANMEYATIGEYKIPAQQIRVNQFSKIKDNHKAGIVGVIGQDIISTLHWKIDFQKKIIKISNLKFPEEKTEKRALVIPYFNNLKFSKVPFFTLNFDGNMKGDFLFDTGWSNSITIKTNKIFTLSPSLVFNKNTNKIKFNSLRTVELEDQSPKKRHKKIMTLDSITINNYEFKNFVIGEEYLKDFNFCTFHFLQLFQRMYYNPDEKKITFALDQGPSK